MLAVAVYKIWREWNARTFQKRTISGHNVSLEIMSCVGERINAIHSPMLTKKLMTLNRAVIEVSIGCSSLAKKKILRLELGLSWNLAYIPYLKSSMFKLGSIEINQVRARAQVRFQFSLSLGKFTLILHHKIAMPNTIKIT